MKKFLLILCTLALLLTMTACKGKDSKKKNPAKDSATIETYADGTPVETDENGTPVETETDIDGNVILPVIPDVDENNGIQGGVQYIDEDGNVINSDTLPEMEVISDGGTEKNLWPSEIPAVFPRFTEYSEMYTATYEDYTHQGLKWWSVSYDTTEAACDNYKEALEAAGFVKGDKDVYTWGKDNYLIEVYPEDADVYFVTLDIYEIMPPFIHPIFPEFQTDYAYYLIDSTQTEIMIEYDCGTNFRSDAEAYIEALKESGFSVEGTTATKEADGYTYICDIIIEDQTIYYSYE